MGDGPWRLAMGNRLRRRSELESRPAKREIGKRKSGKSIANRVSSIANRQSSLKIVNRQSSFVIRHSSIDIDHAFPRTTSFTG
jgi:hypothetical protein